MLKKILAVITGVGAAMIVIMIAESVDALLYPLPTGINLDNAKEVDAFMRQMPANFFLFLLAGYAAAAFTGGLTATLSSGKERSLYAIITGIVLMLSAFANSCKMYHPMWFIIAGIFICLPFAYLGYLVVSRKNIGAE